MVSRALIKQKFLKVARQYAKLLPRIKSKINAYESTSGAAIDLRDYQNIQGFWAEGAGNPENDLGMDGSSNFYGSVASWNSEYTIGLSPISKKIGQLQTVSYKRLFKLG